MLTKPSHGLTLRDRLSHLSFDTACKLLGPSGKQLIIAGGKLELLSHDDVRIGDRTAAVTWGRGREAVVAEILLEPSARFSMRAQCSVCDVPCQHVGGLVSLILEDKSSFNLAAPPPDVIDEPTRSDAQVIEQALAERRERGLGEKMKVRSEDSRAPWTDYTVTSTLSGKTYRVALRGEERGVSYCSCPDYRTNALGTCKHIFKVLRLAKKFPKAIRRKPYRRTRVTVHLRYGDEVSLAVAMPRAPSPAAEKIVAPLQKQTIVVRDLLDRLAELEALGQAFFVTPDAEEFIQRRLISKRLENLVQEIRRAPAGHPLRNSMLKVPLLPYQLDGIAFAAGAGRAIVADEMGLGKTIQGVGVAELLAREANIEKVLIVCPASLKSQWRSEIGRFSGRSAEIVAGPSKTRGAQYEKGAFFTICNYEQVMKDIMAIEKVRWDLIILDEGQRIKNWEAKTSRCIKGLVSRFALVLTGTPLENRLEDLHSVLEFVDPNRLGPQFRFFHRHRRVDEEGKLVGYKNLDDLRARLEPVLLRRTRDSVRLELPARTTEIVRIAPTGEQKELHDSHMRVVAQIVRKPYLSEMDLLRLRMSLLMCRMAANSTFLVDKKGPGHSSKLERIRDLLDTFESEKDDGGSLRKVLVFSEWTTMLDLIEPLLKERKLGFVRLDGSVPQKKRQELVLRFQSDASVRFFLTTNAGSTGLNLQAANTVINVDLPWNPAVLEQRIARAHRMGQKRPVSVFVLVTEDTLEENLLATLSAKRDLALAALDATSTVTDVDVRTGSEELKRRLEVLLGAKPEAPLDEAVRDAATGAAAHDRLASTGTDLLRAAFSFLAELGQSPASEASDLTRVLHSELGAKIEHDDRGRRRFSMDLPSEDRLGVLARGLLGLFMQAAQTNGRPVGSTKLGESALRRDASSTNS